MVIIPESIVLFISQIPSLLLIVDVFFSKYALYSIVLLNGCAFKIVQENIISLPILEGKENLYGLRDILLQEGFLDDTWLGKKISGAVNSVSDFAKETYGNLQKFGVAISEGDWTQILTLLGKGVRFVLRKLREALWSNVGMVVETIVMIFTEGAAGAVLWIPWALVVGLDIYQWANNDYEGGENPSIWSKIFNILFDIMGMVGTAAAGKVFKISCKPLLDALNRGGKAATEFLEKSPKLVQTFEWISKQLGKIPTFLTKLQGFVEKKFPKGAQFIADAISKCSQFIDFLYKSIVNLLSGVENRLVKTFGQRGGKAAAGGLKTAGVLTGFEVGSNLMGGGSETNTNDLIKANNKRVKADYSKADL